MHFKWFVLLTSISSFIYADSLSQEEAQGILKTFIDFHVDQKTIDENLYRKVKKNFINLFDVEKNYLLQNEVDEASKSASKDIQKNIDNLEKGKFNGWQKEFYTFKCSVQRARGLRNEIYRQLLLELQRQESSLSQNQLVYARDLQELRQRWVKKINRFLSQELRYLGLQEVTAEQKLTIFNIFEKKMEKVEEPFLAKDYYSAFFEHFLKVFAKSLDSHTAFFTKSEGLELKKSLEKQFEGIGLSLRETLFGVLVTDIVMNAPAYLAGIRKGDQLLKLNDQPVSEMAFDSILKSLEGPKGSEVSLSLKRGHGNEIYQVNVKRQTVVLSDGRINKYSVPCGLGHIGVIKLSSFYDNKMGSSSEFDLKEAIASLNKQHELLGLILDLRQNSGGFLSQAVKVSGLFINTGVIAVSRYAHGRVSYLRDLDPHRYFDGPLIVLTSKASASAAEVVAGALQDYGRALVVGDDRTYGKGSIQYQNVTDPNAKNYYKITVGRYFTVSGKTTQIDGVKADIHVPSFYHPFKIGERFLENPLSADRIAPHYIDPLLDIEEHRKGWFQKNYLPFLQTKEIFWTKFLACLKANSQHRIDHSRAYQQFLDEPFDIQKGLKEDLPLKEAIAILKDALVLNQNDTSSCAKSK